MSTSDLQGQRMSWRQQGKSGGNRWIGRVLFTLIAAILLILFIWILFHQPPEPRLRAFLVHANSKQGSYQRHLIMPPMFGATAAETIKQQLVPLLGEVDNADKAKVDQDQVVEITGKAEDVLEQINTKLKEPLQDSDDTIMIIFRGYLLESETGPAIACSDFGIGDTNTKSKTFEAKGLLDLNDVFKTLSDNVPESFQGTRLVVLDIEPLTALPEFDQYDDQIFASLEKAVKECAPHVWVLVTRGPLQNAGWDAKSKMPIATQVLLDGLGGEANRTRDDDGQLDLRELVTYVAERYQELDTAASANPPQLLLIRGGKKGIISQAGDVENVRIARAFEVEESESEPESDEVDPEQSDDPNEDQSATARTGQLSINHVAFHAQQDGQAQENQAAESTSESGDPESSVANTDANDTAETKPPADEKSAETTEQPPDTFWDVRDRMERLPTNSLPHPIATAPHAWKRLIQVVLHTEIETLDPESADSRTRIQKPILEQTTALESMAQSGARNNSVKVTQPEIEQMIESWQTVIDNRKRSDDRVTSADQLQHAIVVADIRRWSWEKYRQEAKSIGQSVTPPEFRTDSAIKVLAESQGNDGDPRLLDTETSSLETDLQGSDKKVTDLIQALLDNFDAAKNEETSAWREVRQAHVFLRSPLPNAKQRNELIRAIDNATVKTIAEGNPDDYFRGPHDLARIDSRSGLQDDFPHESKPTGSTFASQFAAALHRNPIEQAPETIIHAVLAAERIPDPKITIRNSADNLVEGNNPTISLRSESDYFTVAIDPDSDTDSEFTLMIGEQNSRAPATVRWADNDSNGYRPDLKVTILANGTGIYRLNVSGQPKTRTSTSTQVQISVEPVDTKNPILAKLDQTKLITLRLPDPDRIRVRLNSDRISDHDEYQIGPNIDGLWLRTYVTRKTVFDLSAYNESGNPARAKMWLVRLEHPFQRSVVSEYFPKVFKERISYLQGRMLDNNGRVKSRILNGRQRLEGPKVIDFKPNEQPTNISWKQEPPAEGEENSDPPPQQADTPENKPDVSNGMALVFQLIDEEDTPIGADQIVWLFPNPHPPEDYVRVDFAESPREDAVKVQVKRKEQGVEIPDPDKELLIEWQEDQDWKKFEYGSSKVPRIFPITSGEFLTVDLRKQAHSVMRLNVDGWPRAIRRQIDHRNLSKGTADTRWNTIKFADVTMTYSEARIGQSGPDDEELLPSTTIYNPPIGEPVFFRGGGESIKVRVHADVSQDEFPDAKVTILEGSTVAKTHRSDRKFSTSLQGIKNIEDRSEITLNSTVEDLEYDFGSTASGDDVELRFEAQIDTGDSDKESAELKVHLDSTPPEVEIGVTPRKNRYDQSEVITWNVKYSDQGKVRSEVSTIKFGEDDGNGKPTGRTHGSNDSGVLRKSQKLPKMEPGAEPILITMVAQVWDKVGLASEPVEKSIRVYPPKPPPKMAEPSKQDGGKNTNEKAPPKLKRGTVTIRINTRSTMRGDFKLSPAPSKMTPTDGIIEWKESNPPNLTYRKVPEGAYTLAFEGTINGSTRTRTWEGLKVEFDKDDGSMNLDLDPK